MLCACRVHLQIVYQTIINLHSTQFPPFFSLSLSSNDVDSTSIYLPSCSFPLFFSSLSPALWALKSTNAYLNFFSSVHIFHNCWGITFVANEHTVSSGVYNVYNVCIIYINYIQPFSTLESLLIFLLLLLWCTMHIIL